MEKEHTKDWSLPAGMTNGTMNVLEKGDDGMFLAG